MVRGVPRIQFAHEHVQHKLDVLQGRIDYLKHQTVDGSQEQSAQKQKMNIEIAQKELELFKWERDILGAKKGIRFGVVLREFLEDQIGLTRSKQGEIFCKQSKLLDRSFILLVHMHELGRLNDTGDQVIGDYGLEAVCEHIRASVQNVLNIQISEEEPQLEVSERFEIFRTAATEFSVIIKKANATDIAYILQALNSALVLPSELNQDPVPLSVSVVSLRQAYDLLQKIRMAQGIRQISSQEQWLRHQDDKRLCITIIRELLQTMNDYEIIRNQLHRLVEKMNTEQPGDSLTSRTLYNNYLKQTLGKIFQPSWQENEQFFDDFIRSIQTNGVPLKHNLHKNQRKWRRFVFVTARDYALRIFRSRYVVQSHTEYCIYKQCIEIFHAFANQDGLEVLDLPSVTLVQLEQTHYANVQSTQEQVIDQFEKKLLSLGQTEGREVLDQLTKNYKTLHQEHTDEPQSRLAKLSMDIELLKRDRLTGLYGRGVFFQSIEAGIEQHIPICVVSIHMAFLRYFDKEGGRETGNKALCAVARILDFVKRKHADLNIQTYRLSGDEFALTLENDDAERIQQIIHEIEELAQFRIGIIPAYPGATNRYRPETLQLNFGSATLQPRQHRHVRSLLQTTKTADELVKQANKKVEVEKTIQRFVVLIQRALQIDFLESEDERSEAQANLDLLYAYSTNVIFGKLGREIKKRVNF